MSITESSDNIGLVNSAFIPGVSAGITACPLSARVLLPFPPCYILLDFFSFVFPAPLFPFWLASCYNYILLSPALNPPIPLLYPSYRVTGAQRTAVLVIADAASLALKSSRRCSYSNSQGRNSVRCRKVKLNWSCDGRGSAHSRRRNSPFPMATKSRCISVAMPTWLTPWPSLRPPSLLFPTVIPPTPRKRAEKTHERQKLRETESIYTKSTRAEDPDPAHRFANTHTPSTPAPSIYRRVLPAQHRQLRRFLCLAGTLWSPQSKYHRLTFPKPHAVLARCALPLTRCGGNKWHTSLPSEGFSAIILVDK